jgi:tetratricopeptide (TPR) repeat protein
MNAYAKHSKLNDLLRQQRLGRGWTLEDTAYELAKLCEPMGSSRGEINDKMIGRWERGEHLPSLYYQKKLSLLYGKSLLELGFINRGEARNAIRDESVPTSDRLPVLASNPTSLTPRQAIDHVCETPHSMIEPQPGAWLALGASDLATLFDEGWSLEEVLAALHLVLQGMQAMPKFSRRTFGRRVRELIIAAVISDVPLPEEKHISAEELDQLQQVLGESIVAGWKLFHTAGNAQVLAVGQAQLFLIQQSHPMLPSRIRSRYYTSVYNLIGKASHFQGRYQDALEAHLNAHVASMSIGDPWDVVQSLICQADSYQALGQHPKAMEAIEEALRLVGNPEDEGRLRSKAQLLASWTENALAVEEWDTAKEKLEDTADLLDHITPNEQFDRASWFQLAGKYAFSVGDYRQAVVHLETALGEIPPTWLVRQVLVLLPLLAAHTWERDREASLATAEKTFSTVRLLNAPTVNKPYAMALRGLLEAFPHDAGIRTFVTDKLALM